MPHKIWPGPTSRKPRERQLFVAVGAFCISGGVLHAAVTSELVVDEMQATPLRYEQGGVTVTWGVGQDVIAQGFTIDGRAFGRSDSVSRIALELGDVVPFSGCSVFAERDDESGTRLSAGFPSRVGEPATCDVTRVLESRTVNRGVLELFANEGVDPGNVERADFIFNRGALAPFDPAELGAAGHPVAERGGDSPVRMAAILDLDMFGRPSSYGPLVSIGAAGCSDDDLCFVQTSYEQSLALLRSPQGQPGAAPLPAELADDTLALAFVTSERLGLRAGQRYHGYSLFATDVSAEQVDLLDPGTFPRDTVDPAVAAGGGLDLYGGLGGYFVANDLASVIGTVFLDSDGNGVPGDGDAGVADIRVTLYRDTDGDGVLNPDRDTALIDGIDSDTGGVVRFHGLQDGTYFIALDEADEDMPGGLQVVPGSNPRSFVVAGDAEIAAQSFPLQDGDGSGAGNGTATGASDGADGGNGADAGDGADGGNGADAGDGADGGNGADAGDGADGGNGADAGDGADGGNGADAGDGADGGNGADAGDGADGGNGADAGDGADGGNGADAGDGADGGADGGNGADAGDGADGGPAGGAEAGTAAGAGAGAAGGAGDGADGGNGADAGDGADGGNGADAGDGADGGNGADAGDGGNGADAGDGADGGADGGNGADAGDGADGGNGADAGDGADGGNGADAGDGADGGNGADAGDGADGGNGADAGDGADGGNGADAGDGADGGNGADAGDGADGGNGADAGDGADGGADGGNGADAGDGADGGADGGNGADAGDGADGGADGAGDGGRPVDSDDSVTTAVADRFTMNQGAALEAPVLDNDTDALDQGLTISAVGESENGTTSIEGDIVRYEPDPEFFGTDSFVYTAQDALGTESTAAVTVTVQRFSDINDDGVNDIEQCEALGLVCDDLTLETGVHGSGVGSTSPVWLMLIAPLAWLRRRIRRGAVEVRS